MDASMINQGPLRIAVGAIVGVAGTNRRCIVTQIVPDGVGIHDLGGQSPPEKVAVELLVPPPAQTEALIPSPAEVVKRADPEMYRVGEKAWKKLTFKSEIIHPLLSLRRIPVSLAEECARKARCHWTTIYKWVEAYRNNGEKMTALLDRRSSVSKGTHRFDPIIENLLKEIIDRHYLTPRRQRVKKVMEELRIECKERGITGEFPRDGTWAHLPHINTLRNRINELPPGLKERKRYGPQQASKYDVRGNGFRVNYPLELIQIDHTKVDLILVDEKTGCRLTRPYLTLAIDVFSRMIVGYYIGFEPPGALATGLCISQAILPKDAWLREHANAFAQMPEWPCYGRPVTIHMDNGNDFRGDMVRRACEKYAINTEFRPVKTPQYGAHIESRIGKFMQEVHSLPGTTKSNVAQRGKNYDSEEEATYSLREFEDWFANEVFCKYHYTAHSAPELQGRTPLERWNQGLYEGTEDAPPRGTLPDRYIGTAAERLSLDFLPFVECIVSSSGVRVNKIQYQTLTLNRWIGLKVPKKPKESRYFVVRYDPRDLSRVFFWNEDLEDYETIPTRTPRPPITLWEFRAAEKALAVQGVPKSRQNESMVFAAAMKQREITKGAAERKGKIKAAGMFRPGVHAKRAEPETKANKPATQETSESLSAEKNDPDGFTDLQG